MKGQRRQIEYLNLKEEFGHEAHVCMHVKVNTWHERHVTPQHRIQVAAGNY
jgi:hypothetical protein